MRKCILPIILIWVFVFTSCSEDQDNVEPVPQSIINLSLELFDGEVIHKKQEDVEGVTAWEVKLRNDQGAEVTFYWTANQATLLKLKGGVGPYNYDIKPGNQLVNLSTAQTVAIGAIKVSALIKWELIKDEEFLENWVYSFEFDGPEGAIIVYLSAKSGDVLQVDRAV